MMKFMNDRRLSCEIVYKTSYIVGESLPEVKVDYDRRKASHVNTSFVWIKPIFNALVNYGLWPSPMATKYLFTHVHGYKWLSSWHEETLSETHQNLTMTLDT